MTSFVIETTGLCKTFGARAAVADLTLQVPQGEVFGFLGPNGAGKSTSVKMLLGLVAPSGGTALVLGRPPGDMHVMARIGFLPEHFRFHSWLQATELLELHGRLYGMDPPALRQRIPEVLELIGLTEHARRPIAGFSKGMLQRIGLAQALLNAPELVFLDEPTSALDPFGRMLVRNIIHTLKQQGTTVFLNSHLLGEVEATCDRVSFIREGRVLETLALRDLAAGRLRVELRVDPLTPELCHALEQLTGQSVQIADQQASHHNRETPDGPITCILSIPNETMLPQIAACTNQMGARLYALTPRHISLEQLFLEIVGAQDSGQ